MDAEGQEIINTFGKYGQFIPRRMSVVRTGIRYILLDDSIDRGGEKKKKRERESEIEYRLAVDEFGGKFMNKLSPRRQTMPPLVSRSVLAMSKIMTLNTGTRINARMSWTKRKTNRQHRRLRVCIKEIIDTCTNRSGCRPDLPGELENGTVNGGGGGKMAEVRKIRDVDLHISTETYRNGHFVL